MTRWQIVVLFVWPRDAAIYSESILDIAALAAIGESCRGLTSINMPRINDMTDVGITSLTQGCINLQSIDFGDCDQMIEASLAAIGEGCQGLPNINMRGIKNMTDGSIACLTQGCIALKSIHIGHCNQLTDASVVLIGERCHSLMSIDTLGTDKLTYNGKNSLTLKCVYLRTLYGNLGLMATIKCFWRNLASCRTPCPPTLLKMLTYFFLSLSLILHNVDRHFHVHYITVVHL